MIRYVANIKSTTRNRRRLSWKTYSRNPSMSFWSLHTQVLAKVPLILSPRSPFRMNTVSFFQIKNLPFRSSWETDKLHTQCCGLCLDQEFLNLSFLSFCLCLSVSFSLDETVSHTHTNVQNPTAQNRYEWG